MQFTFIEIDPFKSSYLILFKFQTLPEYFRYYEAFRNSEFVLFARFRDKINIPPRMKTNDAQLFWKLEKENRIV